MYCIQAQIILSLNHPSSASLCSLSHHDFSPYSFTHPPLSPIATHSSTLAHSRSPQLSLPIHTLLSPEVSLSLFLFTHPPSLSPYSISSTPFFTNTHSLSPNSFSPPTHSSLYPQLSLSLFQLHTTSLPSSLSPNSLTPSLPTQSSPLYPLTDHLFPNSLAPSLRI